jgi:hypothetical protein
VWATDIIWILSSWSASVSNVWFMLETFKWVSTFFLPTHSKHVNRFFIYIRIEHLWVSINLIGCPSTACRQLLQRSTENRGREFTSSGWRWMRTEIRNIRSAYLCPPHWYSMESWMPACTVTKWAGGETGRTAPFDSVGRWWERGRRMRGRMCL